MTPNSQFCLAIAILVGVAGTEPEEKKVDLGDFLITSERAGVIETGMAVDDLYRLFGTDCVKLVDLQAEGFFYPALEVYMGREKPSVDADLVCGGGYTLGRLRIYDERFHLESGIRVGSTLGDLRKAYHIDWLHWGEGAFGAGVNEAGVSVWFENFTVPEAWYKTNDDSLIPDDVKIAFICTRPDTKSTKDKQE